MVPFTTSFPLASSHPHTSPDMILTTTPARSDLQRWWHARWQDQQGSLAFSDEAPQDFVTLYHLITRGSYLFYLAYTPDDIVGAMWLHDLVHTKDGTPYAGWLGTYVLPAHRGRHTTQAMWELMRQALQHRGIRQVHIASHIVNHRAHRVAELHLGFHRVGVFPAFALFQGELADCLILTLHPEDARDAWERATKRACSTRHGALETVAP